MSAQEILDLILRGARSSVRIIVTLVSTAYVFVGAGFVIHVAVTCKYTSNGCAQFNDVKDSYLMVLPVATGVITYWFADRSRSKKPDEQ